MVIIRFFKIYILLCLLIPVSADALAEKKGKDDAGRSDQGFAVIGNAAVYKKNRAAAKTSAIAAAMRAAVNQTALRIFSPDALSDSFAKFNEITADHAGDFVESYQVLAENASDKEFRVLLQIKVSEKMLQEKCADFIRPESAKTEEEKPEEKKDTGNRTEATGAEKGPKVLFLIAEQNLADMSPVFWWGESREERVIHTEKAMRENVSAAGFLPMLHGFGADAVPNAAGLIMQPDVNNQEAADIARQMGADIVIAGRAIVYQVPDTEEGEKPSFNATVTARAILAESGQEMASVLETVTEQHENPAEGGISPLGAAGKQAAEKLAPLMAKVWEEMKSRAERIDLRVTGTRNLGSFVRFRKALNAMRDVKNIQIRAMKSDEAEISIEFAKAEQEFINSLKELKFSSFEIEIRSQSGRRMEIALVPK
ncbi:MAG: hypothetical protein V2I97_01240 [Desulfococcaceae bacterium]|jgi:hypothetical protein|nr:hypothetical protein [Desulfococcaceae bacterium]